MLFTSRSMPVNGPLDVRGRQLAARRRNRTSASPASTRFHIDNTMIYRCHKLQHLVFPDFATSRRGGLDQVDIACGARMQKSERNLPLMISNDSASAYSGGVSLFAGLHARLDLPGAGLLTQTGGGAFLRFSRNLKDFEWNFSSVIRRRRWLDCS